MRTLATAVYWACGLGLLWVVASWADVVLHNTTTFEYAAWNIFNMLFQEERKMTIVTYIVTPKNKKEKSYEVPTLKAAVLATNNRTTGDYQAKYIRIKD